MLTLLAAILALVYLIGFARAAPSLAKSLIKTGSVALLAVAPLAAGGPGWLVVALLFCALGDWLLADGREGAFMAGVGAFAAGHISYVALFLTRPEADVARIGDLWWLVLALAILGLVMARTLWAKAGAMRGPVMGYVPVILSMGVAVLALPLGLMHLAAALFILSDTVLASDLFLLAKNHAARRVTPYVVWLTYWGAQMLFVVAFARF